MQKKKTFKIFIIAIIAFLGCNGNKKNQNNIISKDVKTDTLSIKTSKLEKAYVKKDFKTFFYLFPNSFNELKDIYGYNKMDARKNLYRDYEKHIPFLFDSTNTNNDLFIEKILLIAQNGKWEADAVNLFQDNLISFILKNPKLVIDKLDSKTEKEEQNIWFFIFDGIVSKNDKQLKKTYLMIYESINSLSKKHGAIIKNKYLEMYP